MNGLLLLAAIASADCVPADPRQAQKDASQLMEAGNPAGALDALQIAEAGLACARQYFSPDDLIGFYFAAADAAYGAGRADLQRAYVETVLRLAPDYPVPERTSDATARMWGAMKVAMKGSGMIQARSDVYLDGWFLRGGDTRLVTPGEHLIQFPSGPGIATERVEVDAGVTTQVGPEKGPPGRGERPRRLPLVIGSAALVALGAGSIHLAGLAANDLTPFAPGTSNGFAVGGGLAVGVGVAGLTSASLLSLTPWGIGLHGTF